VSDNDSSISHAVKAALIFGILIGLTGFALLLYAADFWSIRGSGSNPEVAVVTQQEHAPPPPENNGVTKNTIFWMFGVPATVGANENKP